MRTDIDRRVAEIALDPGPGMTPGARELFEEITAVSLEAAEPTALRPAPRPRRRTTLATVAAVTGLVAAAVVTMSLVTGLGTPAYAVAENSDGSINVRINELRDPDRLEVDLADLGVRADISYLKPGTKCAFGRFTSADPNYREWDGRVEPNPRKREKFLNEAMNWPSVRAIRSTRPLRANELTIDPAYIKPGQTLVLEFVENTAPAAGPDRRRWHWRLTPYLAVASGSVKPCTVVPDPDARPWNDPAGRPVATPPAGP